MADWGGFLNNINGSNERDHSIPDIMRVSSKNSSAGSSSAWSIPTSPRKTSRAKDITVLPSSSAPVDIPDWSKIYGMNGKKVPKDAVGEGLSHKGSGSYGDHYYHNECGDDEDEDGDEGDMIPPHEWIARKLARSQIPSFSVCEGIGRTLKGRDLSKVRNAILTKTGFIE